MRCYGWLPEFVDCEITSAQGWAYYAWAVENELTMFGALAERKGFGYIGQERESILKKLKANG